jgi:hypothetical protein
MNRFRVFVDFHNADEQGRLRLNTVGSIEDFAHQRVELRRGQSLTLYSEEYSEELEVDGIVEFSEGEKICVAVIDWNQIRETGAFAVQGLT